MTKNTNIIIKADSSQVDKAVNKASSSISKLDKSTKNVGSNVANSIGGMVAKFALISTAIAGVGFVVANSSKAYAELEQNLGGAKAVFEDYSDGVVQKAKQSAGVMGTTTSQYLAIANKMGSLFQGTGQSVEDSVNMTTTAMQRAIDVASVMGVDVGFALDSVAGMAKGNFTMMDNLGVAMTDTNIEAWLLQKGIQANVNTMDTATKVGYAYQMFMDRTAKYSGNFARESDTVAGSLAIMNATLGNASEQLGQAFAPMITSVAGLITNVLVPAFMNVIPYIVGFMNVVGTAVAFVVNGISSIFGGGVAQNTNAIAESAEKASEAVSSIGSSAGGIQKGLDSATGSAKKLSEQLSGFDEMTVLKDNSADGGGGSSAGGGGVSMPSLAGLGKTGDEANDFGKKIDEAKKKVMAFFTALGNNPFVKGIILAFESIGTAISFIITKAKEWGVFDAINKGFEELSKWFGEIAKNEVVVAILTALGFVVGVLAVAFGVWTVVMGIWNGVMIVANVVGGIFAGIMAVISSPVFLVIAAIVALVAIIGLLIANWETVSAVAVAVWNTIVGAIQGAVNFIMGIISPIANWIYTTLIKPIIDFFTAIGEVVFAVFGKIIEIFLKVGEIILTVLVAGFKFLWDTIVAVFTPVVNFFKGVWEGVVKIFTPVAKWFGDVFTNAWNGIKSAFSSVWSFFTGVWNTITSIFTSVGTTIGNAVGGAFKLVVNTVLGFVEGFINTPINAINALIDTINAIPGIHVDRLGLLSLPRMAKGGIVDRPTLGIFGEAGKEAVIPLENNLGWIDMIADRLSGNGGTGSGTPTQLVIKIGEDTIMDKVISGINDKSFMSGKNVIMV